MWFLPEHRQRRPDMAQRTARRPYHPAPPRLPREKTRPYAGRPAADPPRGTRRTTLGAACPRQRQAQKITGHAPTQIASRFERETTPPLPSPCHGIPVRDVTPRNPPTASLERPFKKVLYSMWLSHLHSAVKIRAFYPVFPSSESTATVFCWLFHWNFREKHQLFSLAPPNEATICYDGAFKKGPPSNVVEGHPFCPLRRTEQPAPPRLEAPHSLP